VDICPQEQLLAVTLVGDPLTLARELQSIATELT
jgi:hypothetical protein